MLGTFALSAGYYDAYYLKAQQARTLIRQRLSPRCSETVDALVTPTSPVVVAFSVGEKTGDPLQMYLIDVCTLPVNIAGLPALSVPCGFSGGSAGGNAANRPPPVRTHPPAHRPRLRTGNRVAPAKTATAN